MNQIIKKYIILFFLCVFGLYSNAQQERKISSTPNLQELLSYALEHRIAITNAKIGEEIGEKEIASALSGYFPQISGTGTLNHYLEIPSNIIGGNLIRMGQRNTSNIGAQANQTILNPSLMHASRAADFIREKNKQTVENEKINTVVSVSKAYYDILTTEEQIKIIKENILRIQKQLQDAQVRYEVGLVDKTDFKRAQISLNNATADLKKTQEFKKYKYDFLKQLLGLSLKQAIDLSFNNENLESRIILDTATVLAIDRRVEYRQLENLKSIQALNTQLQRWQYLPNLSAYANYQLNFFNQNFGDLYTRSFPNSSIGLSLSIPIFQGFKRKHDIRKSELQELQLDWQLKDLENNIGAEYSGAMANYKAYMTDWKNSKENVELSEEVYKTIKLQYDEGIKTYLDLMTAETDLRTSQINYLNALYAVLAGKIDVEKALGTIKIQ